jgi:mRNA interferase HicA
MTSSEMKRWLARQGATFIPGNGSHVRIFLNGKTSVLAMHPGDIPKGTHQAILKQLGLKK